MSQQQPENEPSPVIELDKSLLKYKSILTPTIIATSSTKEMEYSKIEKFLETEKNNNRKDSWNKLDKGLKIQKLHIFAETYGREHKLPMKEIKALKAFFTDCLDKNKLQKTKEVIYDKTSGTIQSIPALAFNTNTKNFTLKIMDSKRVSTLKSLTPKKLLSSHSTPTITEEEQHEDEIVGDDVPTKNTDTSV
jgi:hypothetical protein